MSQSDDGRDGADRVARGARALAPDELATTTFWPHAPPHYLSESGVFMVTAGTWRRQQLFHDAVRLRLLHDTLLTTASRYDWRLEAWAVLPNHYHFIAAAPSDASTLRAWVREVHSRTAIGLNRLDGLSGRKVWHNYWETRLTYANAYLARLHYVHQNPVKHGIVRDATQYLWCSAAWFESNATPAQVRTVYSFRTDRLNVIDDF